MLSVSERLRDGLAWTLVGTMGVEMAAICIQAGRGRTSHFNVEGPPDRALWQLMGAAIAVLSVAMVGLAWLATARPLMCPDGPLDPAQALGWRTGLWLFHFAPISGFAMGGRHGHSVGGDASSGGLPLLRWSTTHGDLRAAHFFAVHTLQVPPLTAWGLTTLGLRSELGMLLVGLLSVSVAIVCVSTLRQALAGRPFLTRSFEGPRDAR